MYTHCVVALLYFTSLHFIPSLHRLSISNTDINTSSINCTGEWIALGSAALGQLLVWEWKSETYVLKQQGHLYGLNAVAFSHDGQYIATGGEDAKGTVHTYVHSRTPSPPIV